MKSTEKATHGCGSNWRGNDGIRRRVSVFFFESGRYCLEFGTWWEGDDKNPTVMQIPCDAHTFEYLATTLMGLSLNRERFRIAEHEEGGEDEHTS